MYTQFYKLDLKPFQISSDPTFMWFGEKHKEALATLKYGILDNKGFLLLTGDVGTGKTSLINALLQNLGHDVICTSIPDPSLDKIDLFNYIATAFGMEDDFRSKGAFLAHFRNFLLQAYDNKKKVLLIIDEAQLLTQDMLEEIRLLSNIEKTDAKLINIFFIGQNEFNAILNRPQNRAVRQRMTLNYNLDPLTIEETEAYIVHRLKVAGTEERLFDPGAVQEIYLYSGGFPRRINILCDHALLSGFVKEQRLIDASIISECARELKIPAHVRNRDINGFAEPQSAPAEKPHRPPPRQPPPQAPHAPYQAPPPPAGSRFPWTGVLILASVLLLVWVLMFPDNFQSTLTSAKKRMNYSLALLTGAPLPLDPPLDPPQEPPPETPSPQPVQDQKKPLEMVKSNQAQAEDTQTKTRPDTPATPSETNNGEALTIIIEKEIIPPGAEPAEVTAPDDETREPAPAPPASAPAPIIPDILPPDGEIKPETEAPAPPAPPPAPPLPDQPIVVRFQYNTNDFTEKGFVQLENFSRILVRHPDARVLITGHTDSQGYKKYNLKLSEFRANIVKSYFLGKGIKDHQMDVIGMGGQHPIETNNTAWGRKMNRRVEIRVIAPSG